ncbi:Uncharacterised protein g10904 [Pycnogonum litorale]
MAKRLA